MKARNGIIVSALLVFGLLSLILFLTIPDARLESTVFWLAFSFAIPVNFLAITGFTIWGFAKSGSQLAKLPTALYVCGSFSAVLLVVGALFMYIDTNKTTFPIILFAIITVAYVIAGIISVLGTDYMGAVEREVKGKRLYIKMLEADVLDCASKAADAKAKAALRAFAESVRFSDPMSHPSLSGIESDLSSLVFDISAELSENASADITPKLRRAEAMLASRNNRCIMLK